MLSSLYGKSLQNAQQFTIKQVQKDNLNEFISTNGNWIYEMSKGRKGVYTVKLIKSLNLTFNLPQFGVQVLSESRRRMNDIINYCDDHNIPIYSIKTDSFTIPNERFNDFEQKYKLGHDLGMFKCEYEASYIKYTSNTTYKAILTDGTTRMRGRVN